MDPIKILPGEHVAIMGTTGSGKSVLARHLLSTLKRAVIIDPKFEWKAEGWKRKLALPRFEKEFNLIWRPPQISKAVDMRLADLLDRALKKGKLTIYVDELQSLTDFFPQATRVLTEIIRTGRSRQVAVWNAMQRPAWVPRWFLSESRHKFVFTLLDKADRKRAGDLIGDAADVQLPFFDFLYMTPGFDIARQLRYNMRRHVIEVQKVLAVEE